MASLVPMLVEEMSNKASSNAGQQLKPEVLSKNVKAFFKRKKAKEDN